MQRVFKEWLGNELADGMSGLQEENGGHKAEKGSGDAHPPLPIPIIPTCFRGFMERPIEGARRKWMLRNGPCSR